MTAAPLLDQNDRADDPARAGFPGRVRAFAINSGTYTLSEVRDRKPINRPARFSFVYRNRGGHWLIVDHHSSAVPGPPQ